MLEVADTCFDWARYNSVRSTNVYEEKSLGVFADQEADDAEPSIDGSRVAVWGRYLGWHARKQLAFGMIPFPLRDFMHLSTLPDMWWLGLALFLLCIIERGNLRNPDNESWFNLFSLSMSSLPFIVSYAN